MSTVSIGRFGEDSAARFLEEIGFTILDRNVHSGHLETDIIAKDHKYIVFAEVKTRRRIPDVPRPFGRPAAAVSFQKQRRLLAAAEDYLRKHRDDCANLQPRIDVIEVYLTPNTQELKIEKILHLPNAVHR